MNSEKYIIARKSTRKGHENEVTAYVVLLPLPDGTKYNKNFPVKNYKTEGACKRDAIKERDRILGKLAANESVKAKKSLPTVDEVFEMTLVQFKKRKGSNTKYEKIYSKWIKPKYGNVKISEITKLDVSSTLNEAAETCVRQHVSNIKTVWKRIYDVAIDTLDIPVKDCSRVEMPPCNKKTKRSKKGEQNVTQDVFDEFCKYAANYGNYLDDEKKLIYNRDIMIYALRLNRYIGVRPQEVRAITRDCIQFRDLPYKNPETGKIENVEGARIAIDKAVGSTITEEIALRDTKTEESQRWVYLGKEGADLLREILAYSKYDIVFADYDGNLISSTVYSDFMNRVKHKWWKDTGHKEDVYAELMRKALSADNYSHSVSAVVTKQQMGHESENMSANWYATAPDVDVVTAFLNRQYKE